MKLVSIKAIKNSLDNGAKEFGRETVRVLLEKIYELEMEIERRKRKHAKKK